MAGHSPSKTGVNALTSRPSRLGEHCANLSEMPGTRPGRTTWKKCRRVLSLRIAAPAVKPEVGREIATAFGYGFFS